jgi:succinate dehydrogenase/fumarate reductase flavoprotein subunit
MNSDVLIVGGGMAGLAAGVTAARRGARPLVVEKSAEPGGSAALSSGIFWTAPDLDTYRVRVPLGDDRIAATVIADFDAAVAEIGDTGVDVTERFNGVMGWGVGHRIDVAAWLASAVDTIRQAGGDVLCGRAVRRLCREQGRIRGAALADGSVVHAPTTMLATGGFQGDPGLRTAYCGPNADRLLLRSNEGSVGDGIRLGRSAGAGDSSGLASFYGHLMPAPLRDFGPAQFVPLTQYHSIFCILVNRLGRRFCDESRGDEVNTQALLRQPDGWGVLICDERVRTEHVVTPFIPHTEAVDRFGEAVKAGADYVCAGSVGELVDAVAGWGVPAATLTATLAGYTAASCGEPVPVDAPLPADAAPLTQPPLHALRVQPSITFTFGGLRIDGDCRVLDRDRQPVGGLYAAGADAGGLSNEVYAGGLAPAYITGRRAAMTAAT